MLNKWDPERHLLTTKEYAASTFATRGVFNSHSLPHRSFVDYARSQIMPDAAYQ